MRRAGRRAAGRPGVRPRDRCPDFAARVRSGLPPPRPAGRVGRGCPTLRRSTACAPPCWLAAFLELLTEPDVLLGEKSGDRRTVAGAPALARRDEQTRQPRMDRQSQHRFAQWRDPRGFAGQRRPEARSSRSASASRSGFGASNQSNCTGSRTPQACSASTELERSTRWISGCSNSARPRCSRSDQSRMQVPGPVRPALPGALIGRRATDPDRFPAVDSPCTIVADGPCQSAVDDRRHPVDRERRLGDVRAQDDLATVARPQRAILLFGRQRSVQRKHDGTGAGRGRLEPSAEAPYLGKSRQKDEQMT